MKKKSKSKALIPAKAMTPKAEATTELTVTQVLAHPAVVQMTARLETVQKMLAELPRMIGEAVAEATRKAPPGTKGPAVKVVKVQDVEIHKDRLVIDGQQFETKDRKDFR